MAETGRRIRTLIVDDEPLARERLRSLLAAEPDVQLAGECADGATAVREIEARRPQLLFLDVQMPEMDGFEVLRALEGRHPPAVVFVTAYDRYAIRAFEVHALDYLLKPFDRARFAATLARARRRLREESGVEAARRLHELLAGLGAAPQEGSDPPRRPGGALGTARRAPSGRERRIVIRSAGRVFFLGVDEVDRVEAAGNYVRIFARGASHLLRSTMKAMEDRLDPEEFVRVHRSHIVRIERIRRMEPWFHGEYVVVLEDGTKIPSGAAYGARVRELADG